MRVIVDLDDLYLVLSMCLQTGYAGLVAWSEAAIEVKGETG